MKHSNSGLNYTGKSFITLTLNVDVIKLFGIIYSAICTFTYDFDWGYADGSTITSKKFKQLLTPGANVVKLFCP
jgi:hypothetical protein